MNNVVLLPLRQSMAQRGPGKNDPWRAYMTVLVINHGIIKSISILTAVIHQMIAFDVHKPHDCFCQEVQCTPAIRYQLRTISVLDLGYVHHLPHALLQEGDTYCLPEGKQ